MAARTTKTTVSFLRPLALEGYEQELPAGEYLVETDEELIQGLSFPAYRRTLTTLYIELLPGRPGQTQALPIDPKNLDAALMRDRVGSVVNHRGEVVAANGN